MRAPDCCAEPTLKTDERFTLEYGPFSTRVARCAQCGAWWHEEWSSRTRFDGEPDDERFDYQRLTPPVLRCPRCKFVHRQLSLRCVRCDCTTEDRAEWELR